MTSMNRVSLPVRLTLRALFLAGAAASLVPSAQADEAGSDAAEADEEALRSSSEIVVIGSIGYRNRNDEPEPKLVYDEEYFQRFEPLTAGDALKRVPSVTFLSDVIESDGARLRGLDPGYTQILINGEKVPGTNADRSFFLDRIPAELIKQVEIVRSSSARRTGDAVAGTLNIVLRDAFTMDGGYIRGGGLLFDDGKVKPSGGLYYGGPVGPGRLLAGFFHSATFVRISSEEASSTAAPLMRLLLPWMRTRAIFSSGVVSASSSRLRKRRGLVMLISMFLSKIFRKLVMLVRFPKSFVWRFSSERNCCWRAMRA